MANKTTIQISKKLREELKKCKKYPRETYIETIERMMKDKRKVRKDF